MTASYNAHAHRAPVSAGEERWGRYVRVISLRATCTVNVLIAEGDALESSPRQEKVTIIGGLLERWNERKDKEGAK